MKRKFIIGGSIVLCLAGLAGIASQVFKKKKTPRPEPSDEEIRKAIDDAILRGEELLDVMYSEVALDWDGEDREFAEKYYNQKVNEQNDKDNTSGL